MQSILRCNQISVPRVSGDSVDDMLNGRVVLNRWTNVVTHYIAVKKKAVYLMYL